MNRIPGSFEANQKWRNIAWGVYVLHPTSQLLPMWNHYIRSIFRLPIVGYTSTDSRFDDRAECKGPCFCDICKRQPNYPYIFGDQIKFRESRQNKGI